MLNCVLKQNMKTDLKAIIAKAMQNMPVECSLTKEQWLEAFAVQIVDTCAKQCNPEPGFKYSPNSLSARIDCKNKILELTNEEHS